MIQDPKSGATHIISLRNAMILEPRMMQPNEFHRTNNDSGAQSGASHLDFLRKKTILETRIVQPIYMLEERQGFWGPEWCNPYNIFQKMERFGNSKEKRKQRRKQCGVFSYTPPPGHMAGGGRVRENYVCLAFLLWGGWGVQGEWGVGVGEVREHISAAPSHATYISSFRN